ncbi:bifunctional glycosyltransferase/CDP-glycerol:glycerophosphate glycerophosphotransferase [Aeromonas hydrophila]|uniref:bifunctional glycosyltransferase/CDP-glycerol:glycerophosphate glycerophosphotransferase n=1 Tax=Aeromonas hydrophila TaxID=644 RepID=UPI0020A1B61C|nr:bifunctional glycosyltransferase family 2 protein/CDP-glycerol:glycerophosphate glycerophosphotransferase [Aeromonas hydrophila]MCP1296371.1 bifunctional glycosyltransferase family 2 protein/CDP-glycerol:glycerophosphate glycerophosphotransferase [Aeromonas hydrophila]
MNKLISIIIPVYNVEKYIKDCLESLLIQTVDGFSFEKSIEVILIDDGSPDKSVDIIRAYQKTYNNIYLIQQENAGQSVARNNAIKIASGEYIFFLDSDDLLPPDALSPLYKLAKDTLSEVIVSHSKAFNSRRSWFIEDHAEVASAALRKVKFFHHSILVKTPAPWAKLYKRNLLLRNNIEFPVGIKLAEDWIFVMKAMYKANHISTTPHISYLYRGRDDEDNPSCTQIVNEKVFYDLTKVYELTLQFGLPERQTYLAKLFVLRGLLYRLTKYSADSTIDEVKPIYKHLRHFLTSHIGDKPLRVFTPVRRLPLLLIYHGFYSEAHRVMNGVFKKSCLNKGIEKSDNDIIQDYHSLKNKKLKVKIRKIKNKVKSSCINTVWKAKYSISKIVSTTLYKDSDNIVLVGERLGKTANDSSYHVFSHVQDTKKYKGNKEYYYVIDSKAKTKGNLDGFTNVIKYGSLKHFVIFNRASTYVFSDSMRDVFHQWQRVAEEHKHKRKIFLQHGIFALNRATGYYDKNSMEKRHELPDKFIVSSDFEKQLICRQFGFDKSEVSVTGLSRFDKLPKKHNKRSRKILILPTWRDWLSNVTEKQFTNSQYYKKISELLASDSFIKMLEEKNMSVDVCLHHKMHAHLKALHWSDKITVNSMNDIDVQSLIVSADIMITDYSSASFDMLYQRKPVLYYWFDAQKFFSTRGGPLVCPRTGIPGPVVTSVKSLIDEINNIIADNLNIDKKYEKIANKFFTYRDNKNSKRIVELIES